MATNGWTFGVDGSRDDPKIDVAYAVREDEPRIYLEVSVPGLGSVLGEEQTAKANEALDEAMRALQTALGSDRL